MKRYNTLCAVPGWMFGTDLTVSEVTEHDDNSVTVKYPCSIGWMARPCFKELKYPSVEEFKNELDFKVTVLYSNKFLNREQRLELNSLLNSGTDRNEVAQKSFEYAKRMIKLKYERNLFNHC